MSANSLAAEMVSAVPSTMPASFGGNDPLYAFNLFLMTSAFFLGVMMAEWRVLLWWRNREHDLRRHPITLYRLITFLAASALILRCGAEAMVLWGWNPNDPETSARVIMAKRWIDPVAILFGFGWLALVTLSDPAMEKQLRKTPIELNMWSRWPVLKKPAAVFALSLIAATAAVALR